MENQILNSSFQQDLFNIINPTMLERMDWNLFSTVKPTLVREGDKWMCLLGDNIQVGICGFGDSPYKAVLKWNEEMYKKIVTSDNQ